MKITDNKIEIFGEMYFCSDFNIKSEIANNIKYLELSKTKTNIFVEKIEIENYVEKVEKPLVEKFNDKGENITQKPQFEEITKTREIKGEKVYLKINLVEKEKVIKNNKLDRLRKNFDLKINNFLSSYPNGIRETFTLREKEAKKFIETGNSDYLDGLVTQKNLDRVKAGLEEIVLEDFANKIIQKADAFKIAYNKLESWYDLEKEKILNNL